MSNIQSMSCVPHIFPLQKYLCFCLFFFPHTSSTFWRTMCNCCQRKSIPTSNHITVKSSRMLNRIVCIMVMFICHLFFVHKSIATLRRCFAVALLSSSLCSLRCSRRMLSMYDAIDTRSPKSCKMFLST